MHNITYPNLRFSTNFNRHIFGRSGVATRVVLWRHSAIHRRTLRI